MMVRRTESAFALPLLVERPSDAAAISHKVGSRHVRLVESDAGQYVLVADGSRIYSVTPDQWSQLSTAADAPSDAADENVHRLLSDWGVAGRPYIDEQPPRSFCVRALSLAVAQKCNLGCTYCYAEGGDFGAAPVNMPDDVALLAVDRLFADARAGERVTLSFLGGEPLTNRQVLRAATVHAASHSQATGINVQFSVTTNGTLLTADDADFFEAHGFAVTLSIDGIGAAHDALRPTKSGRGTFDEIINRARPLLKRQRTMQVSARATVTPANLSLRETLDELIDIGFHSVGFSPMIASPRGSGQMGADDLRRMLDSMIECGNEFQRQLLAGQRYPFLNMVNALREIHQGTHRPYPCGAGGGYFGVSADGLLFACHRFVNHGQALMGDLVGGVDPNRQAAWLAGRHVNQQEPCRSCWARYLCGGGCHHEVLARGRKSCDYIRGWLDYCLRSYTMLLAARPDYFGSAAGATS